MSRLIIWKRVTIAIALVAMLAAAALWEVRRARAFNPQPDPPGRYTMVGIVRGQSIRINASNLDADEFFIGDTAPARLELRPVFRSASLASNAKAPPDPCVPSVEVIDNATSKTSFVYEGTPLFGNQSDRQQ
jgi:hypothetical protein